MTRRKRFFRLLILGIMLLGMLIFTLPAMPAAAATITGGLYPSAGPIGAVVTVNGTGFNAGAYYIFFNTVNVTAGGVAVGADGVLIATFTVPTGFSPLPGYNVYPVTVQTSSIYNASTIVATETFTVTTEPVVSINPATEFVAKTVTVSGTGYTYNSNITIYFDALQVGSAQSNASGTFSGAVITVPESTYGIHTIKATDAGGNYDTITFNTKQSMTINPTTGMVGGTVNVRGTGFRANREMSVTYKGIPVTTTPATLTTNTSGSFNATFIVPSGGSGASTVEVSDGAYTASASFTTSITMSTNQTTGPVGTSVTVTGKGFQPNVAVSVTWDGAAVANAPTDNTGSFSYQLAVPPSASGTHQIGVNDGAGNVKSANFAVTSTATFSGSSGTGGSKVTVSGTGFAASSNLTITFDGKSISNASTDATGTFSKEFAVPAMAKGTYKMEISDGVNKKSADYTVITSFDINKTTGNIGTEVTASGTGFNGAVTIKYDTATVATTTAATGTGDFSVTFKVPVSVGGAHTITGTDGINNIQKAFTMETEPPPVPTMLLPIDDEKAEAQPIFSWAAVSDPSGLTYTFQLADDASFTTLVLEKKGLTTPTYALSKIEKLESTKKEAPYYWRVKAIDGASNEGAWSTPWSFYVGGGLSLDLPTWARYLLLAVGALIVGVIGFLLGKKSAYSY